MPTDFRDGRTFPRSGRRAIGEAFWLARLSDKARAAAAGTIHDYIYPCPLDRGVLERWGISVAAFEDALQRNPDDDALHRWLVANVPAENVRRANRWLLEEKMENLERQDAEEGVAMKER